MVRHCSSRTKGNLTFNKCSFLNSIGTVIDANDDSCITDAHSTYENNTADLGAVFYILNSKVFLFGSRFRNNKANRKGGVALVMSTLMNVKRLQILLKMVESCIYY